MKTSDSHDLPPLNVTMFREKSSGCDVAPVVIPIGVLAIQSRPSTNGSDNHDQAEASRCPDGPAGGTFPGIQDRRPRFQLDCAAVTSKRIPAAVGSGAWHSL